VKLKLYSLCVCVSVSVTHSSTYEFMNYERVFVFAEVRPNNGEMKIVKWTREVVYVAKF
jgi:hypothetical protein